MICAYSMQRRSCEAVTPGVPPPGGPGPDLAPLRGAPAILHGMRACGVDALKRQHTGGEASAEELGRLSPASLPSVTELYPLSPPHRMLQSPAALLTMRHTTQAKQKHEAWCHGGSAPCILTHRH